ncbi:MAG: hypothetical protein IRZ31_16605 [Thermogemmatispora sp.]|uniref:hypothetical protein n=1 Tax=Thermogemmatispora sp. TaxID=1968838 RepID=UPI0026302507|nr:hypothetical protein [Thermogemmatispora sp.]MBX5458514.1 hypothetical protein [Thermogemmatispora sp.]
MMQSRLAPLLTEGPLYIRIRWHAITTVMKAQLLLVRRRVLSLVVLALLGGGFLLATGFHLVLYVFATLPVSAQACPTASTSAQQVSQAPPCVSETPQQQAEQKLLRQEVLREQETTLTFPMSLSLGGDTLLSLGVLLLCIFVAIFVGSDYQAGTQRLVFLRGVPLTRFVCAQCAMLLLILVIVNAALLMAGALLGCVIGPLLGGKLSPLSLQGWGELALYWLGICMSLWLYALLSVLFTTLGRSIGAGIAGSIGYLFIQGMLLPPLTSMLSALPDSGFTTLLRHLPALFLGPASHTLLEALASRPLPLVASATPSSASTALAGAVLLCYGLISGGVSLWLVQKRDVAL